MNTEPSEQDCEAPLSPGDAVGRWVLGEVLGRGASATVFAARHAELNRSAALKVLHHGAAFSSDARTRFLREGRAAASMTHAHAVAVYDVAVHQGVPYLVMERIEGETLSALLLREGKLPIARAVDLFLPIADALCAAHRVGIVHRDVKPANIAIVRDREAERPVLLDFGAARLLLEQDSDLTKSRAVLGTPAYMAPEQALAARSATPASDQFALAAVLLEMVSASLPYSGSRWTECFAAAVRGEVQDVSSVAPDLPREFARALSRALSPNPLHRFSTLPEFASALWPFASAGAQSRWSKWRPTSATPRRSVWPLFGVAARVVAAVALGLASSAFTRTAATSTAGTNAPRRVTPLPQPDRASETAPFSPPPMTLRASAVPAPTTVAAREPAPPVARRRVVRRSSRRRARDTVDAGTPIALGPNDAPILSH